MLNQPNPPCPRCGGETKIVPAGISKKTGKPYKAFYSCKVWECGGTARFQNYAQNSPQNENTHNTAQNPQSFNPEPSRGIQNDFSESLEKIDDLTKKVNEMAHAIHALKVVLINGDKDRENAYELHRIPLVEKKEEPKEEEITTDDIPF